MGAWTTPRALGDPWLAEPASGDKLIVAYGPAGTLGGGKTGSPLAVAILDQWSETIPSRRHTTEAAFGFNAPKTRAPQGVLVAVPPDVDTPLDTATLVDIVGETRRLARARMGPRRRAWRRTESRFLCPSCWPRVPRPSTSRGSDVGEWSLYRRPEPPRPLGDMAAGVRAEVADPAWLLGRQWQLGEHQGEDASSPVEFRAEVSHTPIAYDPRRPDLDPTVVPAEALVEAEPDDWWTIGRRIRLGRAAAPLLAALAPPLGSAQRQGLTFGELPEPYAGLAGELDGLAVFRSGLLAGQAIWVELSSPLPDRWRPDRLVYEAAFTAGGAHVSMERHGGGDVDWYSVDGTGAFAPPPAARTTRSVIPGRLRYPGAPHPRW